MVNATSVSRISHSQPSAAAAIHRVMTEAYRVEAALLGVADFPPLRRTAAQVAASTGTFLGISVAGTLAAVAELELPAAGGVHIASLAVRPAHFRRGLASALLRHVREMPACDEVMVSTAAGNGPALALYAAHGFREQRRHTTPDGVEVITLRRPRR